MTDRLIHALSRQPVTRLVRPVAALLLAVAVAYAGGAWLVAVHRAEGMGLESGFVTAWLRDATVALPIVALAVWFGILATRKILSRAGDTGVVIGSGLLAVVVGGTTAAAMSILGPLHAVLFPAHHSGPEMSFAVHALRDLLIALPVNVAVAGAVAAILARRRPWEVPQVRTWVAPRNVRGRLAIQGAFALVLLAPLGLTAQIGAERASALAGPGAPCPAGAPTKTFDVSAINVDIPLNRFGDHDAQGKMYALNSMIPAIRAQEASRHVSSGLRDDPIQPLVVRANLGDCVVVNFTNQATGEFGMHIDGLMYGNASSGDAVGVNAPSSVGTGGSRTYVYYVPNDPELEGARYIRPGPGNRNAVSHGLFGSLVVEPAGATYLHPDTGQTLPSGWGWEATIAFPDGRAKAFRESALLHHEIGDEKYIIPSASNDSPGNLPVVDPNSGSYRPGSRALNYRSEPFIHRLAVDPLDRLKAFAYNSYTFGDPATPMVRGYLGDPTKIRLVHAGAEMFHVYHLHGGGDRWRANPHSDSTWNYADTGLNKTPVSLSKSQRLDSQSIGPGESYNLEIEGGAGGVQQGAGDFLYHCHIAEHYVSGMWSVWRVFDTRQPEFAPLPDRSPLPSPVDSTGLIGKTINGQTITAGNLAQWVEPQLPPQGVPQKIGADPISLDGAVWNWTRSGSVYYGEPEDTTGSLTGSPWAGGVFPNLTRAADGNRRAYPGHPGLLPVDAGFTLLGGTRPRILFNPTNGRPAYPLLRPHIGQRAPYSPNGHSGAPWLGERANQAPSGGGPDPWANRPDGLCPAGSGPRNFNVVAIHKQLQVTRRGQTDAFGKLWVLAKNKDLVRNGTLPAEPLAIRANVGDCVTLTVTSEQTADDPDQPFPMANLHIHHVQFDPNGSDGASAGMVYNQSVRPYRIEDAQLASAASGNQIDIQLSADPGNTLPDLSKFRVGVWIGVGLGTEDLEVRQITDVNPMGGGVVRLTLNTALAKSHPAGQWAGTEFVKEIWYPDVLLDNIFWHDHVDGIKNWGHGLVGQLIIEPPGSTYHDPKTGAPVDSGALVDIRTSSPLAPGVVDGSFREFVMWTLNQNPAIDSTINLRSEPLADRRAGNADPSLLYSSYTHGDPWTPLPRAYAGDPFVIRSINVGSAVDTFHVDGHKIFLENRATDGSGNLLASPVSAIVNGVSERFTLMFKGGAGGGNPTRPGDYLYTNGIGRRHEQGAWGIVRVLPAQVGDLQPLPGTNPPSGAFALPTPTGGRPVPTATTGDPCPAGAPTRSYAVSAVDVPGAIVGRTVAYVPTPDAAAVSGGTKAPEPLVLHVAAGECVDVTFTNARATSRASFHVDKLLRDVRSSGVNVGFNPEQTVAPGGSRGYRFYVDAANIGSAVISDYGGDDTGVKGLYGAIIVAPAGASFVDPVTGAPKSIGTRVDVRVPGSKGYRDFSVFFSDNETSVGSNTMPYPPGVESPTLLNYGTANGRALDASQFSSLTNGDPATTLLQAYPGDPMRVHVIGAPGGEQAQVFNLGGHSWAWDPGIPRSEQLTNQSFGPLSSIDAHIRGGAGGAGDYYYGAQRRPFSDVGQWGLLRVYPTGAGPIRALDSTDVITSRPLLSKLTLKKTISKKLITKKGLGFSLQGPNDIRALRVKLYRLGGKRPVLVGASIITTLTPQQKARLTKKQRAARSTLSVTSTGRMVSVWKPAPALLKKLKAGRYRLDVQGGVSRRQIEDQTVRAGTRITAPPVKRPLK